MGAIPVNVAGVVSGLGSAAALGATLALAYGVVTGGVALITGWRLFSDRKPPRYRRGAVVPPESITGRDGEDVP